nr:MULTISPECIES: type II toxin-antitoxin system VapC family toxin [unclassified Synechococcus]
MLDSHALLWWWFAPERLSGAALALLVDPTSRILVSAASVWELSLKHHQGKLPELATAMADLPGLLQADGFQALPISLAHGLRAGGYSQPHRDPFDRMLAAQAELERLLLLTADPQLSVFPCQTFW